MTPVESSLSARQGRRVVQVSVLSAGGEDAGE